MKVIITPDADTAGRTAAAEILDVLNRTPHMVLGLATGSSPTGIYTALKEAVTAGRADFSGATGFALDEYVGIPADHPESYVSVINRDVTVPLRMNPDNVHVPNGRAADLERAAWEYDTAIADAGGVDIQILGIGSNGHIGFNEPSSSFGSRTRVKTLAPQTRIDNARFFDTIDDVPVHCLTQGLGTILDARRVVLIATGPLKAAAIAAMIEGPVTSMCPGSVLQWHPNATIVIDEAAASALQHADYYRYVRDHEPQRTVPV